MKKAFLILGFLAAALHTLPLLAQEKLSNEKIWYSAEFASKSISGVNSMNDGVTYTRLDREGAELLVNKYDYKSNKKLSTIAKSSELLIDGKAISIQNYTFNADETSLLIGDEIEGIYRHSSKGFYYAYNLKDKSLTAVSAKAKGKISLAEFSPDGSKIAFVRENNLFINELATKKEIQLTNDGLANKVINGMSDWVYEEEFGTDKAFQWSPKGTKLAYCRFDESAVKQFQMAMYGELYPEQYTFKYPKAGEKNATVAVKIYDLASAKTNSCKVDEQNDQYIPRIKWTNNDNVLAVARMNRLQNKLELLSFDFNNSNTANLLFEEKNDNYVELNDDLNFLSDGSFFLTSERDGFNHIYHFNNKGQLIQQVTKGSWDVTQLIGFDEKSQTVYYQSAEQSPTQRDIYAVKFNGANKSRLSPDAGTNTASFSKNFKYFINYHSTANTPTVVSLYDNKGKLVNVLEDNAKLKSTLDKYQLPKKEFFDFKSSTGYALNGWMIKPDGFNPNTKYPVFMTVYNGPGINTVNDSWGAQNMLWHCMLAQQGYIVVSVDGRGTGFRGADFKKSTYKQLGRYETEDQIASAQYFASLPFVDKDRIGIQGWSYGGYMTLLALTKGADVFKMGISVAPVTNWRFYDSIYTERYLQTPQDNAKGYDENSPINFAKNLKGKLLLVHGSADDNVHYQNSMEMVDALVKANRDFDLMIYPNKNHGIYGGTTRLHLYNKMTNYIKNNL